MVKIQSLVLNVQASL